MRARGGQYYVKNGDDGKREQGKRAPTKGVDITKRTKTKIIGQDMCRAAITEDRLAQCLNKSTRLPDRWIDKIKMFTGLNWPFSSQDTGFSGKH